MRIFLLVILASVVLHSDFATDSTCANGPPAYARQRQRNLRQRNAVYSRRLNPAWRYGSAGYGGPLDGYYPFQPGFAQPVITGSWYSRPYPYHFDYYRQRFRSPAQTQPIPTVEASR